MSADSDLLLFVHVPKAGGSTLRSIMMRSVLASDRLALDEPSPALMDTRLRLFAGHVRFGLHQGLTRPVRYFTMMREPIGRYVSDYFYAFHSDEHRLRDEIRSGDLTLEQYLMHGDYRALVRQVSGLDGNDADNPALAIQVMEESYALVGVMERFDETALLLAHISGWGPPLYLPKNRTQLSPEVARLRDAFEREAIPGLTERYATDITFFEAACRHLDRSIALAGPLFPRALAAFRTLQRAIANYVKENDPPETYEQADFRGEDPLPAALRPLARTEEWRIVTSFLQADSALRRRVPPLLHGRIESVGDGLVKGWATRYGTDAPVHLLAVPAEGEGVECIADIDRPDMEGRGFLPAPRGFAAMLSEPAAEQDVAVFFEGSPMRIAVPPPIDLVLAD